MVDTALIEEGVEVMQTTQPRSSWRAISWSAAISGAITALAVSFLVIALGSGIGLAVSSPYGNGPSATSLTIAGAVWMVLAQSLGFAAGGFVAGRTRTDVILVPSTESNFRDGVHGLISWGIGALIITAMLAVVAAVSAAAIVRIETGQAASAVETPRAGGLQSAADPIGYFVDALVRSNPSREGGQNSAVPRDQVARIMLYTVGQGRLADDDRAYLTQIVAAQTGMSMEDAQRRVDDVVNRALDSVRNAADAARKAGAYFSFWTFMSLLFGAVAAVLGGLLGGERRDEVFLAQASLAPR